MSPVEPTDAGPVGPATAQPVGSAAAEPVVTVTDLHPTGDLIRVRAGGIGGQGLSADVTPQAAAELGLAPGMPVAFSVKATEIAVYRV